ncbi:MAG TPA: hypothetical protein VMG14_08320 [Thermoplasmata archaeon]|nr:hypothetical protein [Thermoplasmata archaeon]
MDAPSIAIAVSLLGLTALLVVLSVRALVRFRTSRSQSQVMWGAGLALAAAAMGVESVVFLGSVSSGILQAYVFLSAAIVGVLSLGATRILGSPRVERAYTAYMLAACGLVAAACAISPLPTSMVTGGIIVGNPPIDLIVLSSLVTVPATIVLLTATAVSLRRSRRWQTLLMAAGAIILGAGGTLYIASFPIALYYAEFIGILLLFLGLISLQQPSRAAAPAPTARAAD